MKRINMYYTGKMYRIYTVITVLLLSLVALGTGYAQDTTAKSSSMNNTMKQVFKELKSGNEDSAIGSILMIVAIACVVGVALYMSFKSDSDKDKKPQRKNV